jgi:hypothetical protein
MAVATTMLYRASDQPNPQVWDWPVEHQVFPQEEVEAALAEGWVRHPADVPLSTAEEAAITEPKRRGRPPKAIEAA